MYQFLVIKVYLLIDIEICQAIDIKIKSIDNEVYQSTDV